MISFFYHRNNWDHNFMIFFRIVMAIVYLNIIDKIITVLGVSIFGMKEANPLFLAMSGIAVLWFILLKTGLSLGGLLFLSKIEKYWIESPKGLKMFNHYLGFLVVFCYSIVISMNITGLIFT